jgi:hypothetical protein
VAREPSMSKEELFDRSEKREIVYSIVSAFLAGAFIFIGALTSNNITKSTLAMAILAFLLVFVTNFKQYWEGERNQYMSIIHFF